MASSLSWFERNASAFKILLCGILLLILMIPTSMLRSTVNERANRASEARGEIMSKWGAKQVLTGPIISVPYTITTGTGDNIVRETRYYHILPDDLSVTSHLMPELRTRGIYTTIVYTSKNDITAAFPTLSSVTSTLTFRNQLDWNKAVISYGITDMKGIQDNLIAKIDDKDVTFEPGLITADVLSSGVSREIALNPATAPDIALSLNLRGGEQIQFLPLGKETHVTVDGNWPAPSFNGDFLPEKREVTDEKFTAEWHVTHYNRNFPQQWNSTDYQLQYVPETESYAYNDSYFQKETSYDYASYASPTGGSSLNIGQSAFGVKLIEVVDHYDKVERTIKYAFLIIGFSFLAFFLMEVTRGKPIHILQYLLIGFALVIFYTLLLSISEHVTFNFAYIVSGLATIGLVTLYSRAIWDSWSSAGLTGGILVMLYGLVFVILQSEDYALLIGSISIFVILSMLMYFTRRIDWYNVRKG